MRSAAAAGVLLTVLSVAGAVRAEVAPEVELVVGVSEDVGGGGKQYWFDRGYLLGLRGVAYFDDAPDARWRWGAEAALDVMHYDWLPAAASATGFDSDPDALRERLLAGARLELRLSPRFQLFGRALVGFDHYATDGVAYFSPDDPGLSTLVMSGTAFAAELGVGGRVTFGHLVVGLQCGLPVAFYRTPDPGGGLVLSGGVTQPIADQAHSNLEIHATAVDVEGLLTVGVAF